MTFAYMCNKLCRLLLDKNHSKEQANYLPKASPPKPMKSTNKILMRSIYIELHGKHNTIRTRK